MSAEDDSDAVLQAAVEEAHQQALGDKSGKNADYIPYLAGVDSSLFGVAVATVDGRRYSTGDAGFLFALESISKVFTMALAMEKVGAQEFHRKVGADPTGMPFNSILALELNKDLPLSPLVNAGAMSSVSAIPASDPDDRWRQILAMQSAFAGRNVELSTEVNESEQSTNFHNRAIAWLLHGGGAMYCDPMEACDVYTRQCSTLVNTTDLAIMGATLANGGINPITRARVVSERNVPHLLAEMTMEGLYTRSGDFAYTVGLPGKSGVGGGLLAIAPGRMALAAFSPRLDPAGNSVRGWHAIQHLADTLKLGLYT